jgi:HNH endonuclease/AP2 domain
MTLCIIAARAAFSYDPSTGCVTRADGLAARRSPDGYLRISLNGSGLLAHRVAWLLMTGAWPLGEIDHINRVKHDNRWCNLRDVSKSTNQQNRAVRGIKRHRSGRWEARIRAQGAALYLGVFDTPEQAHEAYLEAKRRLHAGFNE